jgi:hypothetical protein
MVCFGLLSKLHAAILLPASQRPGKREFGMNIPRSFLSVAIAAAFSATLLAQQAPSGYHTVACIKIKPGKSVEFDKWNATDGHAYQQARVDSGATTAWMLLRSVIPAGESADCDYLSISVFPGTPPEPTSALDKLEATLKKAGLTMSAQEFMDHRTSLTDLISNDLFQNQISVGTTKKGDYLIVNSMKVSNIGDWLKLEKEVWQPIAESMVKAGVQSGWSVNGLVLPGGADLPIDAVTVDIYPSWDAVFTGRSHVKEHFQKAHPDMEFGTTMERIDNVRTIVSRNLFTVADMAGQIK